MVLVYMVMIGLQLFTIRRINRQMCSEGYAIEDEKFAERILKTYGFDPVRFSKKEKQDKQTPDFKVIAYNEFLFYCEVKSIVVDINGGIKHDTIQNNITDNIHEAYKQFQSVNSSHFAPNVLIWISHDNQIDILHLYNLFRGSMKIPGISFEKDLRKFCNGRIKDEKYNIDLHLWLYKNGEISSLINTVNGMFTDRLCRIFKLKII